MQAGGRGTTELFLVTACQRSCGKVMFSVMCVCVSVYKVVPTWPLPMIPLVSHRSHGNPATPSLALAIQGHSPGPSPAASPYRDLTQDIFKLFQLTPCIQGPFRTDWKEGSWPLTERPNRIFNISSNIAYCALVYLHYFMLTAMYF